MQTRNGKQTNKKVVLQVFTCQHHLALTCDHLHMRTLFSVCNVSFDLNHGNSFFRRSYLCRVPPFDDFLNHL